MDFADACRRAARELLEGRGWGKRELAGWLSTRYAPLVASAPRRRGDGELTRPISEGEIAVVLFGARRAVHSALVSHGDWVEEVVAHNHVVPAIDEWGASAFMPWSTHAMGLAPRVLSLLAADTLIRHHTERVTRTSETRLTTRMPAVAGLR